MKHQIIYILFLFLLGFYGCNSLLTFQGAGVTERGRTKITAFGLMTHSVPAEEFQVIKLPPQNPDFELKILENSCASFR